MRRGPLLVVLVLVVGVLARPALAAPPPDPAVYADTLTSDNFVVHFTGDLDQPDRIVRQLAGELAANAEWARETFVSWGFPAPLDDGDGNSRIEIWVGDLDPIEEGLAGLAVPIGAGPTRAGYILVDDAYADDPHVIAHEVFHLVQYALYVDGGPWFYEATAEWAAFRLRGYPTEGFAAPEPDGSLDCQGAQCGLDGYEAGGYSRWTFWQYLGERFGQNVVKEVWDDFAAHADPDYDGADAAAAVLATKGTSLADAYNDYSRALLTGSFEAPSLKSRLPLVYGAIETPSLPSSMVPIRIAVNRLATRFLQFTPPSQPTDGPCYAATLTLTVTVPAGTGARPHFYWPATGAVTALSVSGATATAAVPWDTCSADAPAYLSLPNASQTLDARAFLVAASLAVDTTKVVTAKEPPAGATLIGTVLAAPTDDPAPTLHVYAPDVLRLASSARLIRLVVYSSGTGRLQASFGGADLGTVGLRAGANRVALRLPRPAARMVSSRRALLELTSLAPDDAAWGTRVTQRIAFTKAAPKRKRR